MTTVATAPTAAQLSTEQDAAIAAAIANPAHAWLESDIRAALGTIDLSQFARRSPERKAIDAAWRWGARMHLDAPGIALHVDLNAWDLDGTIEVEIAAVTDADEFLEQWGEPATHARALGIAQTRLSELDGKWRDEAEDQLQRLSNENAAEAWHLRSV